MNSQRSQWLIPLLVMMVMGSLFPSGGAFAAGEEPPTLLRPALTEPPIQPGFNTGFQSRGMQLAGGKIEWSAPVLADLNRDGKQEIIVGSYDGRVWAIKSDGTVLWSYDMTTILGPTRVDSTAAVGDVNNDGYLEVVMAAGKNPINAENGGVFLLSNTGQLMAGWPKWTTDLEHDGYSEGVYGSPTLVDLDLNGDLEIVVGAFDKHVYAWHHDGSSVAGFPVVLIDTIWSSPAAADIDKDSYPEIIIGTDVGNFWPTACPYPTPWSEKTYCGGSLWAFNHDGSQVSGFPIYVWDIIQSSPAIADLNEDGWLDIIVGTGTFYYNNGAQMKLGQRLYGWDHNGQALPGWEGGKVLGDIVAGSPAIGDIDNDGHLEVVAGTERLDSNAQWSGAIFAYERDGTLKWKTLPKDWFGNVDHVRWPVLADYNNDGIVEVLFNFGWEIAVVRGTDGAQLTYQPGQSTSLPTFYTNWSVFSAPAVGDIDNDRIMEVVAAGASQNGTYGAIYVWQPSYPNTFNSMPTLPWPMYRHDARHTGTYFLSKMLAGPSSYLVMHPTGGGASEPVAFSIANSSESTLSWSVSSKPTQITFVASSGTIPAHGSVTVNGTLDTSGFSAGMTTVGNVVFTGTLNGMLIQGSPVTIPVRLYIGTVRKFYLPIVTRNS